MAYTEIWSPNKYAGNGGYKKSIIVIHTSEPGPYAPGRNPGTAAGLGKYLSNSSVQASYHIEVDPNGDVCRSLSNSDRAWAAGDIGNNEGYHICAVGWSAWSRSEWLAMPKMLDSMAVEVANWCRIEGIPANYVPAKDLPNNVWGITTHHQTALAWRQTDHTDPGPNFPMDVFIDKVRAVLNGGNPSAPVETAIQAKRRVSPWLGKRVIDKEEYPTPDGKGRFCDYENGMVYWHPATGAQALSNEMVDKYGTVGYETGFLGYPVNDVRELANGKGRAQAFQNGSIYFSEATGARIVNGAIGAKWAELGWEQGFLGMPETDEIKLPDGKGVLQKYQGGHMYYSPETGANAIVGIIWDRFTKEGYESALGYPVTSEIDTPSKPGKFQIFQFGHVYWKAGEEKAYAVSLDFMDIYAQLGYENGRLSFPVSNKELVEKNIWTQKFLGGSIQIDRDTKKTVIIIDGEEIAI